MPAPGPIARGAYLGAIRSAGRDGLSRCQLSWVAVPGLGPLKVAERDEVLRWLVLAGVVEQFEHRPRAGNTAVCWRSINP